MLNKIKKINKKKEEDERVFSGRPSSSPLVFHLQHFQTDPLASKLYDDCVGVDWRLRTPDFQLISVLDRSLLLDGLSLFFFFFIVWSFRGLNNTLLKVIAGEPIATGPKTNIVHLRHCRDQNTKIAGCVCLYSLYKHLNVSLAKVTLPIRSFWNFKVNTFHLVGFDSEKKNVREEPKKKKTSVCFSEALKSREQKQTGAGTLRMNSLLCSPKLAPVSGCFRMLTVTKLTVAVLPEKPFQCTLRRSLWERNRLKPLPSICSKVW